MSNIIDSIQLSGVTYGIKGSGGTETIELTQAQYDALAVKDPNTFYIITDATAGDLTNYYTKTETNTLLDDKADTATTYTKTEVDTALGGKQATLQSGTNIKTINNESILGSGNIDIQGGGGGGKAVSGGTNISITTGETADTINCTLNLENGTNSQSGGLKLKSFVAGNEVTGRDACAFGGANRANGTNSFVTGYYNTGNTSNAFVSGNKNQTTNSYETLFGSWALSNGSHTEGLDGYSDATLLAVGNGNWRSQKRHNAFEIRQNGDIYIADTNDTSTTNWYEKPMIKLQDQLGGSSITIDPSLDSGSTNPVANSAITTALNNKQIYNSSGYFYDVMTSYQNSGGKYTDYIRFKAYKNDGSTTNVTKLYFPRINGNKLVNSSGNYTNFELLEKSAITSAITSASTDVQVPSAKAVYDALQEGGGGTVDQTIISGSTNAVAGGAVYNKFDEVEQVTAAGFNAVNDKFDGLKLKKLTQAEYDALTTKDAQTLYIIVN